ncbi:MAG: dihydroneopterin aldolase, partial [Bacteroidota bacterium]
VETNVSVAAATDDLYKTVNYETIYLVCKVEMRKSTKLIETVAQRILSRLGSQFGKKAQNIMIRIRKMHPPLGGKVRCSVIEIDNQKGGGGMGSKGGGSFSDFDDDFDF